MKGRAKGGKALVQKASKFSKDLNLAGGEEFRVPPPFQQQNKNLQGFTKIS
jgi:hypothetical protein